MIWQNYLHSLQDKLSAEALLLLSSLAWLLLRLFGVVGRRLLKGGGIVVEVLGKEILEVRSVEERRAPQAKEETLQGVELDILKTGSRTSSPQKGKLVLYRAKARNAHTSKKEVDIKHGSSSK